MSNPLHIEELDLDLDLDPYEATAIRLLCGMEQLQGKVNQAIRVINTLSDVSESAEQPEKTEDNPNTLTFNGWLNERVSFYLGVVEDVDYRDLATSDHLLALINSKVGDEFALKFDHHGVWSVYAGERIASSFCRYKAIGAAFVRLSGNESR